MGKLRVFELRRRFIIKSEDDQRSKKLVFIIANFFIAKGKIAISKISKLKSYIDILLQMLHMLCTNITQLNINKIIQRNNKNKSTQFLMMNFEH